MIVLVECQEQLFVVMVNSNKERTVALVLEFQLVVTMISVIAVIIMLPWKRRALSQMVNLHSHAAAVSYVASYTYTIPN